MSTFKELANQDYELTKRDELRMGRIKWRKGKNGLYFGAFQKPEQAFKSLKKFYQLYKNTPRHINTIKDLCERYQQHGIYIYPTQAGKWLKEVFNATIKYQGYAGGTEDKRTTSLRIENQLYDVLHGLADNANKRSWWINAILKLHAGLPSHEIFVFMEGVDEDAPDVTCMFYIDGEEWRALYIGLLHKSTRKLIQSLCQEAELHGPEYLIRKAKMLGFYVIDNRGGTND